MARERGFTSLDLWVMRENAAGRAFYACLGGRPGDERREIERGHAIIEAAYVWPDLVTLVGA
jgi:hypothetical protein